MYYRQTSSNIVVDIIIENVIKCKLSLCEGSTRDEEMSGILEDNESADSTTTL
jgi:hypothetical protein